MQTKMSAELLATPAGQEANAILRSCVHCGFCTATCPTYQLLGDELDGPRGRIYLIKEMMENSRATTVTLDHLDRCLSCRACETTCPSGVEYGHLLEAGKSIAETLVKRPFKQRLLRILAVTILPHRNRFALLLALGRRLKPLLPERWRKKVPARRTASSLPHNTHPRRVLLIEGCVQPSLSPEIDAAAAHVFDRLNITTVRTGAAQCCGAIENHLNAQEVGLNRVRANIDRWLPFLDDGVEAIISTASACALEIKEYGYLLRHDPDYADKAVRISQAAKDSAEIIAGEDLSPFMSADSRRIAFHAPCTLQHGQKLPGAVESILLRIGYELTPVQDAHLCCGSAGSYSILQPEISGQLRDNKLAHLTAGEPAMIVTANIGCLHHMQSGTEIPVRHWLTLLADQLAERLPPSPEDSQPEP